MEYKIAEERLVRRVEDHGADIDRANDSLWEFAETALEETQSSAYLKRELRRNGFSILPGAADTPTSFVAQWGSGKPCIGFLAEYDALKGLSQDRVPECRPLREGAPGHACGHCTLGAAILGAVLALKDELEREQLPGVIRFYGCPAEESLEGKVRMSRDHLFDDCDAAFSWHPNDVSYVWARKSVSLISLRYTFHGKPSHAGLDPWNGRSALDAVELMNVGANYLREHIPPTWRLHYTITDGGAAPNIVPERAQVWYMLRADDREQAEELHRRVSLAAEGAAMMTETRLEEQLVAGCYHYLPNAALGELLLECMKTVGAPQWTDEDRLFAKELSAKISPAGRKAAMQQFSLEESDVRDGLVTGVYEKCYQTGVMGASTDVGDVSWQLPVGCFSCAATVVGAPGHSWFYTAASGSGIGKRGARAAAKILALAGYRLLTEPELLSRAKAEHQKSLCGKHYCCPLPPMESKNESKKRQGDLRS